MPTWNADQYLRFADERTQPCRDLVARIQVAAPRRVVDLGCGPGNSTAVLAARWPQAEWWGLDSSEAMIAAARRDQPAGRWEVGDIAAWAGSGPERTPERFDVVFSNAALQWVPDHAALYPRLLGRVAPGGALAVQVPGNPDAPAHRKKRALAASARWRDRFPGPGGPDGVRGWHTHELAYYHDLLATEKPARIDLWATDYVHVLPDVEAIVAWYQGTGLRPFLDGLATDRDREEFLADYREAIREDYPPRPNGQVLFPFRRLFLVAYRSA